MRFADPLTTRLHRSLKAPVTARKIALAAALPLVALLLQWSLWTWISPAVWFFFFPAVYLAARLAGRVGAWLSATLSVVIVAFVFIPPEFSWGIAESSQWVSITLFLVFGWLFGELTGRELSLERDERDSLRKRAEALAAIVDSTDDAVISGSLDGRIITWNQGAERMYGYTAEEAIGQTMVQYFKSPQKQQFFEAIAQITRGETVRGLESRRIHKSGSEFLITSTISPIRNEQGEVIAAAMIARDITQAKHDQEIRGLVESRFESLFNSMEEGFFLAELIFNAAGDPVNWRYLDVNPAFTRIAGISREAATGSTLKDLTPDFDTNWFSVCAHVAMTGESGKEERFVKATQRYYANNYYSPQRKQFACIFSDITNRRLAEEALRASESRYARVMEGADQGFWEWDLKEVRLTVSRRFESMLGYGPAEYKPSNEEWWAQVHPHDLQRVKSSIVQNLRGTTAMHENEFRCRTKAGGWCWVLMRGKVLTRDTDGRALVMSGTLTDISHRKQAEQTIWQQANFDPLTQLPNRNMLRDRLSQEIKKSRHDGTRLATLFIDLDNFKEINDTLGHAAGDELLVIAAQRIRACVRDSDTVSRQGGDEFTVLLPHASNMERVEQVAQSMLTALAEGIELNGEINYVSASIGIALYPDDATDADGLHRCADQAMYAAKDAGRNRFSFFTRSLQDTAQTRMRLTNDLRNALADKQFRLVYQPIVDLKDLTVYKAEALIRWQHPRHGMVSPAEFIPLAESSGLIVEIGEWVFQQAALQTRAWRTLHHPDFQISVNKSPVQFSSSNSKMTNWANQLKELGLPGCSIVVEITEGLLLTPGAAIMTQLSELREGGVGVSLDDFGTGYSSLSYLQKFDIDYVKIDQSFVRNLRTGSKNLSLCKAIIVMAHELGMKVIAEGVETAVQRELLTAAGCDYGQGYLFSRPVPALEFDLWMGQFAKHKDSSAKAQEILA